MNTDLTTAEMRSRLEELKRQLEEGDKGYTGLVITSVAVVGPAVDLAFEALARRERAAEEKVACMCGHPRTSHDCHGKCYDIATRGWCSCANFTESPVTDGED